jgi:hypothetical protein
MTRAADPVRADPVRAYLTQLDAELHGPDDVRRDLLREARDGLEDAAEGYERAGLPPRHAAELAVRDFGPVSEIAPRYQDELAADQGRRTALLLAVGFPLLMLGWDLVWTTGGRWDLPSEQTVPGLPAVQDVISAGVAVLALALLVVVLRRTRAPRRVAALICGTALVAVLATAVVSVAMHVPHASSAWRLFTTHPGATLAYLLSAGTLAAITRSAWCTLRAARSRGPRRTPAGPGR